MNATALNTVITINWQLIDRNITHSNEDTSIQFQPVMIYFFTKNDQIAPYYLVIESNELGTNPGIFYP